MESTKETVFQMQQNWCTYELTETVAEYTELTQARARWGASTERGKWAWSPTPKQKAISNWQPHRLKGKVSFLSGGKWVYKPHWRPGLASYRWKTQNQFSWFWRIFFVSLWAVFTFLFFCLYYGFWLRVFFVRVREHTLCSFFPPPLFICFYSILFISNLPVGFVKREGKKIWKLEGWVNGEGLRGDEGRELWLECCMKKIYFQ